MIASGIFDKTKEAVAKTEKEGEREKEILEDLINKLPEESEKPQGECLLNIAVEVPIYNESLGEFPVVFKVTGKDGEAIVYEDFVATRIFSPGTNRIQVEVAGKDGIQVEIEPVYSGGSYKITEGIKIVTLSKDNMTTVSFTDNYDYSVTKNSTTIIRFHNEIEYRNSIRKLEIFKREITRRKE